MRGNSHVRFGGRAEETDRPKGRHRASVRPNRTNATGLVASGVDVKTAQGLLGHSDSRLTLDHYAQVVTELGEAAAAAMGTRFMKATARDERAMEGGSGGDGDAAENDGEGL